MLSTVLLLTSAGALLFAVLAVWQSLRGAFGATDPAAFITLGGDVGRQALEDEKAALLRGLKDLKFEFDNKKLSDADYRTQERILRSRTREVMRLLDVDIEPFRPKAEQLVAEVLKKKTGGPFRDRGKVPEGDAAAATKVCGACGARNDLDATFCKKCGAQLEEDAPEGTGSVRAGSESEADGGAPAALEEAGAGSEPAQAEHDNEETDQEVSPDADDDSTGAEERR